MVIHLRYDEGGDWVALYVNGVKVEEGHSLNPAMVATALGLEFTESRVEIDYDTGSTPDGDDPFPHRLP